VVEAGSLARRLGVSRSRQIVRWAAPIAYVALLAAFVWRDGVPASRDRLLLWIVLGLLAFSTANPGAFKRQGVKDLKMMPNDAMDPLFLGVIQSVEESVLNALVAAETMKGINGNTVHALPHDRLREVLKKYNRLKTN